MNTGFPTRRLILGLLAAAVAAVLGVARVGAPTLEQPYRPAATAVALSGEAAHLAEWRAARGHTPKAPLEKAARTRRPGAASGSGVLPPPIATGALSAPVVRLIRGTAELVALRSECGHCTRAPRPPPIS